MSILAEDKHQSSSGFFLPYASPDLHLCINTISLDVFFFQTESLKKHLECLKLCGDETEAHNQILESLDGVLLALAEDS